MLPGYRLYKYICCYILPLTLNTLILSYIIIELDRNGHSMAVTCLLHTQSNTTQIFITRNTITRHSHAYMTQAETYRVQYVASIYTHK